MRTEQEMLGLLTRTAQEDPRIRAAYLEGSRANPNVPRDVFQDYDVEYIVTETASFRQDRGWIDRFGERLYMQYPEDGPDGSSDVEHCYGWLIQLADGNRLDLHVCTAEHALKNLELYRVLVDKDGRMPQGEQTSDRRYWVERPGQEQFRFTCNEFWWCLNNVAKGLWRDELPYVMDMLDTCVRPMLKRLLEWRAGCDHGFSVSAGKSGKYLKDLLPPDLYRRFLSTYALAEAQAVWEAVFRMCDLFQEAALDLSGRLSLVYDMEEARNSRRWLEYVHGLPADAAELAL